MEALASTLVRLSESGAEANDRRGISAPLVSAAGVSSWYFLEGQVRRSLDHLVTPRLEEPAPWPGTKWFDEARRMEELGDFYWDAEAQEFRWKEH